jgi:23S rRNA G2069 N7-methylase RlmK/C1962 C5-methylase RlmI
MSESQPIAAAVHDQDLRTSAQCEMLVNRVNKNVRRLRPWLQREQVSCYRLYDRDIPEIPLVIDWYEGRMGGAEYDRPHDRTVSEHESWLDTLMSALANALNVPESAVWLKRRQRQRGASQYRRFSEQGARAVVSESGLKFEVNLSDYLDTGLFLDHRHTRRMVGAVSGGRTVLNLFAYTGAFSVHAGAGGARLVTTVDTSQTYLDWAKRNWALNGLGENAGAWVRMDAAAFAREADSQGRRWDIIVCDPPTFSNSHSHHHVFDVAKDHGPMLERLMRLLKPDGELWFSTNAQRFRLEPWIAGDYACEEMTDRTIPPDFRNTRIHRCWRLQHHSTPSSTRSPR